MHPSRDERAGSTHGGQRSLQSGRIMPVGRSIADPLLHETMLAGSHPAFRADRARVGRPSSSPNADLNDLDDRSDHVDANEVGPQLSRERHPQSIGLEGRGQSC